MNFHGETVVVIPGATSPEQAGDNAGAMDFKLSGDDLAYLDEVSAKFRHRDLSLSASACADQSRGLPRLR